MTLRLGWIGCGRQANEMLLPALVRHDVALEALCDVDTAALERTARRHGVQARYHDHRELLAHPGIDAVGIAVGPREHPLLAVAALEHGLAVFVEKPPASDRAGAERIADAARAAGRPALVGFMKRYSTGNRIARNLVLDAEFGRPLGFFASYTTAPSYFEGEADYTAFYLHHCVHYMDLAPWLMGSPVADMTANRVEAAPGRMLLHLHLRFASGAVGTIEMGTVQSRGTPVEQIRISGDHRRVEVSNVVEVTYHRDPGFKVDQAAPTLGGATDTLTWKPNFTVAANEDHKGYHALLGEVIRTMRGEPGDAPTIDDGVSAMAGLERMIAAIEQG